MVSPDDLSDLGQVLPSPGSRFLRKSSKHLKRMTPQMAETYRGDRESHSRSHHHEHEDRGEHPGYVRDVRTCPDCHRRLTGWKLGAVARAGR